MQNKHNTITFFVVSILLFCSLFIINSDGPIQSIEGITIFVDNNYNSSTDGWMVECFSKIQDAINNSRSGDTIYVFNGTYYENIIINKSVTLDGENRTSTVIDGKNSGVIIRIIIDAVSIRNFTIQDSGETSNDSGVEILTHNNIIEDCVLMNNRIGVCLQRCGNNIICNNILLSNMYGIGLRNCNISNLIKGNFVYMNEISGIFLTDSANVVVENNSMRNNTYGVALSFSRYNSITENEIVNNTNSGINIYSSQDTTCIRNIISGSDYGIILFLDNINTSLYNNILIQNIVGIGISADSTNTRLEDNMYSNNIEKIREEQRIRSENSIPGFKVSITLMIFVFVILFRERLKIN